MRKILLMSDIHITDAGDKIVGLDPLERFQQVLDHALTHHGDADHIILMGDLAHHGKATQYQRLKTVLDPLTVPMTFMLGNHDRRAPFHAVFGGKPDGFLQTRLTADDTTLLCLDSLDEGAADKHSGLLCPARLAWLQSQLAAAPGPVIVLCHHHLIPSGFDGMDAIALRNADQVGQLIAKAGCCQMVINGHIHRIIFGSYFGVPHAMIKSPCHQMPMKLGPGASSLSIAEPGGYGLLCLSDFGPILHHVDVGLPAGVVAMDAAS